MSAQPRNESSVKIPLWIVLIVPFVVQIVLITGLAGYLSFRNGQQAVNNVTRQLRREITSRIEEHLVAFLKTPHQINRLNASMIRQGSLDVNDPNALERHFWDQIQICDSVTSIYFGNTEGGLVDAGREGTEGSLYVIATDGFVSGPFNKYATDGEGNRTDLLVQVPDFDARTRTWYTGAVEKGDATWSDIYILFTGQDMAVAASYPVYDERQNLLGVASVDIFTSHISDFLQSIEIGETGSSFIMERSGLLVASSTGENPFTDPDGDEAQRRLYARESEIPTIRYAAEFLTERFDSYDGISDVRQLEFEMNGQRQFLQVSPVRDEYGMDWLIVVVIPESDFMMEINANNRTTAFLTSIAMMIAIAIGIVTAQWVTRPIFHLNVSAQALAKGEWKQPPVTVGWIAEIGDLMQSFNNMAEQLKQTLGNLRSEIAQRKEAQEALGKSQAFNEGVLNTTPDVIYVYDLVDQVNVYSNEGIVRVLGYSVAEVQAMKNIIQSLMHPDDFSIYVDEILPRYQSAQDDELIEYEYRLKHKHGGWHWMYSKELIFLRQDDGTPKQIFGIVSDITERKQAEEALRNEKEFTETVLNSQQDTVFLFEPATGRAIRWNQMFNDITGYTDEEIAEMVAPNSYYSPEDLERASIFTEEVLETGSGTIELELICRDGHKVPTEYKVSAIMDEEGRPRYFISIGRDITDRKKAEEALKERTEFLDKLIDSSALSTWISDEKGTAIRTNPACLEFFGATEEEVIGKYNLFQDVVIERAGFMPDIQRVFERGEVANIVIDYDFGAVDHVDVKSATHKVINSIFTPILDADGKVSNVIVQTIDLTDIKRAEKQIKASLEEKEVLLQEIHHRVKNNLAIVSSLLSFQAEAVQDERVRAAFRESQNRVHTMARIHEHLYRSSDLARIDMAQYVQGAVKHLIRSFGAHHVALQTDISDVELDIDRATPCGLIINELVSNALKYAFPSDWQEPESGPKVCVVLRLDNGQCELVVSDNGIGLPLDVKIENLARDSLGLRLVHLLTRQLGGNLEVTREGGTTFCVTFAIPEERSR